MIAKHAPTFWVKIWMAGNYPKAEDICREYCTRGMCVSICPMNYIYTGGEESGFCVTLINYPRFPAASFIDIKDKAHELALLLIDGLYQQSYTLEDPVDTLLFSKRSEDMR